MFHVALINLYVEIDKHGLAFTRPLPDLIEGEEEYKVKSIISHIKQHSRRLYLVKWKGYLLSKFPWKTVEDPINVEEFLSSYLHKHNL